MLLVRLPAGPGAHRRHPGLPAARRRTLPDHPRPHLRAVAGRRGPPHRRRRPPRTRSAPCCCAPYRHRRHAPRRTCRCTPPRPATATCSAPTACPPSSPAEPLRAALSAAPGPDEAVDALIELAYAAGRPGQHRLRRRRRAGAMTALGPYLVDRRPLAIPRLPPALARLARLGRRRVVQRHRRPDPAVHPHRLVGDGRCRGRGLLHRPGRVPRCGPGRWPTPWTAGACSWSPTSGWR